MFVKFLNDKTNHYYSYESHGWNENLLFIKGVQLPQDDTIFSQGCNLYDEEEEQYLYENCEWATVLWDKDDQGITLARSTYIHYTYLVYDSETGYVVEQNITTAPRDFGNEILYRQGCGKEFSEEVTIFDEDGFSLFKVVDGQITSTTANEKEEFVKQNTWHCYYETTPGVDSNLVTKINSYLFEDTPSEEILSVWWKDYFAPNERYFIIPSKDYPQLLDENNFPLFKIVDGAIASTNEQDRELEKERLRNEAIAQAARELRNAKDSKIAELRTICGQMITKGIYMDGDHHYSYDASDQANINNLVNLTLQLDMSLPYHADGEDCRLFSKEELVNLYVLEQTNVTHHTTYYNQAKSIVENMGEIEEVKGFKYGDALTGKYLDTYNAMMTTARAAISKFIGAE